MNILFICENYLPHYGGAEVVFKNLAERFAKNGHSVSLVTHRMKETLKHETINNVHVHRVPSLHSRYLFTFSSIPKALKLARHHDIIQTTTFNGAFPAWLAAKIAGKPVVLTVHEVWVGKWRQVTGFSWLKSTMHDLLERAIYLFPFDHYICVSNATKNDLLRRKIPEEKVSTIYNGVDYEFWDQKTVSKKDTAAIREELGAKKMFLYFAWGRPGASKGFEYLINAVPHIREKLPHATLLLMLSSVEKYPKKHRELLNLVASLNLPTDAIKILPSVPYAQLKNYIAAADCIVVPSLAEGFGYSVVDSCTMGKPIIASNAGSIPEVIFGTHLLAEPKNSKDIAAKVIEMANKQNIAVIPPKRFEWEKSVEGYLEMYQRLVQKERKA